MSGLVSYNFDSLKAKKSLGLSQTNHEEDMLKHLQTLKKKLYCSRDRSNRILSKSSAKRYRQSGKMESAILNEFEGDT